VLEILVYHNPSLSKIDFHVISLAMSVFLRGLFVWAFLFILFRFRGTSSHCMNFWLTRHTTTWKGKVCRMRDNNWRICRGRCTTRWGHLPLETAPLQTPDASQSNIHTTLHPCLYFLLLQSPIFFRVVRQNF